MSGRVLRFNLADHDLNESGQAAHMAATLGMALSILERVALSGYYHADDRAAARDAVNGIRYLMTPPDEEIVKYTRPAYKPERREDGHAD